MSTRAVEQGIENESQLDIAANLLDADESILYELAVNLGLDGEKLTAILVVTNRRIMRFEANDGKIELAEEFSLASLSKIEAQALVGNGRLNVWVEDRVYTIARYTLDLQPRFLAVAGYITRYIEDKKLREIEPFEAEQCPRCGRPFRGNSKVCPACIDNRKVIRRLWEIVRPYRWLFLGAILLFNIRAAISLFIPQLERVLIDDVLRPQINDLRWLLVLVGGMALGQFLTVLLTIARNRLMVTIGSSLGRDLRNMVYARIQALSLRFIDQKKTGDLMNRIGRDTNHIQSFLQNQVPDLIDQLILFIGIGVIIFATNWRLALLVFIPAPIIVWATKVTWQKIRSMYRRQWRINDKINSSLQDVLSGIRVVKAFGKEEREVDQFKTNARDFADISASNEKAYNTFYPLLGFIMGFGNFLILYFGGKLVLGEEMLLGEILMFSTYAGRIYQPLQYLTSMPRWFHQAMISAERIFEVIDQQPDVQDREHAVAIPNIQGKIELKGVTFGYIKHEPVLKNINLTINAGEMLGLVGHSGAGKSTLINLINRFYDVDEGEILIDGVNIKDVPQRDLRSQIGVVLQDTFLFSGTIWENIAYAKPDATPEDVIQAAKVANAHDFIVKFTDGYDTRVGERGQRLSGGERQRVAIARAVLHNPKILILDEATSSVDSHTEKQIQEAIQRLAANRTTIAIAHRLSTLRYANRLMVLDHGNQVETGTHEELMELEGYYYRLVMAQQELANMEAIS